MKNLYLKNAHVIDPASKTDGVKDLWVEDSKFVHTKAEKIDIEYEILDLTGKTILPGLVDLRCHVRNAVGGNQENIRSVSQAACAGGFTTLLVMPNISPFADNPGSIRYINECASKNAAVNFYLAGALTDNMEGRSLSPIGSLKESGVLAITDSPLSTQNNEIFVKGVEYASMFDLPVIDLPRELSLSKNGSAHDSVVALSMGLGGYPRMAEEIFVQRSITVSKYLDAHIHLSSISSKGSVELINDAKNKGIKITADTTPHHLCLTDEKIRGYHTYFKTHPPLREEEDRESLVSALLDGTIDNICTGHEPHQDHLKKTEYDLAPAGVTSLDTCFSAIYTQLFGKVENLPYKLAEWLSYNPSKIIKSNNTNIQLGSSADFIVIDLNKEWIYSAPNSLSLSSNNPFDGCKLRSMIERTYVEGELVYKKP